MQQRMSMTLQTPKITKLFAYRQPKDKENLAYLQKTCSIFIRALQPIANATGKKVSEMRESDGEWRDRKERDRGSRLLGRINRPGKADVSECTNECQREQGKTVREVTL
jgi:hypothetical protein